MRATAPLRTVIADDEAGARTHLRALLGDCSVRISAECATGQELLDTARRIRPDFVCLDIRLPDLDGLEVARRLDADSVVVFTTGYADYAAVAFDVGAADYLLKPLAPARVAEAVRRVRMRLRHGPPSADPPSIPRLFIPTEDHRIALTPESIRFVEARGGEAILHTDHGAFRLRAPLSSLEPVLAPWGFLRTHRGYLVNLRRVTALVPWSRQVHSLLLDGTQETHVPVAKSRLADFRGSVIWISHTGGQRGGSGTAGKGGDRGGIEPRAGLRDRRGAGI
jgi:DNA-binding LytR/AlgR family response regulator